MRPRVFTPPAPDPRTAAALDAIAPPRYPVRSPVEGEELPAAPDLDALRARIAEVQRRPSLASRALPQVDPGRILARVARRDGTELRVSLHAYEGKPYVRVGPWQSSAPDAWPVRGKGTSLRRAELGAVAAALLDALDAMNDNAGPERGDR